MPIDVDKFGESRARLRGALHPAASSRLHLRRAGTFPNYFPRNGDWGKDSVMFARQLYKQAAITPSSCREFRTLLFVNAPRREFRVRASGITAAADAELFNINNEPRGAGNYLSHFIMRTTPARLQFSCPIRSETLDYTDLFNTTSHCIKRTSILYRFASNWFYRIQFGSRIIAFPSRNLALKNGGRGGEGRCI